MKMEIAKEKGGDQLLLTKRTMEHKKEPMAISRPEEMGQRMRYSHINKIDGVITAWRKSEHGKIRDQSRKRNNVFKEGQHPSSGRMFMDWLG
jgi:hypothetical protein